MPVKHLQRSVAATRESIRKTWSREERQTRKDQAAAMQLRLFQALGVAPALAPAQNWRQSAPG